MQNSEGVHYRSQLSRFIERMILGHVGAEQEIQALKCELEKKDESDILAVYPLIFDCGVEKLLTLQEDVSEIQALYHPTQVTGENAKEQIRSFLEQLVRQLQYSSYKEQYRYVEGAKRYIQEHYDNSMISLDTLSSYLGISSSYLSTLLSRFLSMGFTEYLNRFRLEQAKPAARDHEYLCIGDWAEDGIQFRAEFRSCLQEIYGRDAEKVSGENEERGSLNEKSESNKDFLYGDASRMWWDPSHGM